MKVKVIKRADIESLGQDATPAPKKPKRRRLAEKVEKWVTDIRERADAESRVSIDDLFTTGDESST